MDAQMLRRGQTSLPSKEHAQPCMFHVLRSQRSAGQRMSTRLEAATISASPERSERRSEAEIPESCKNSIVRLKAPNSGSPGSETDVYLLGMSHVSNESVEAVRSLIETVKPEVAVVELCKDRVNLIMNPDGPKALQMWNTRRVRFTGPPKSEGWPSEEELLSVIQLRSDKAFTTPDAEADCVALLSTGLFKNARPVFRRPNNLDGPHFVKVKGDQLATVPPLGTVEFLVTPRVLPAPTSFSVRVDSSLANAGIDIPQDEVQRIRESLLSQFLTADQKEARGATESEAQASSQTSPDPSSNGATDSNAANAAQSLPDSQNGGVEAGSDPALLNKDESEGAASPEASSSVEQSGADMKSDAEEDNKEEYKKVKVASIDALLKARKNLIEVLKARTQKAFDISLQGVDTGQIEAVIKARQTQEYTSGLEGSAAGGEGFGVEKFRPQRGPLQVSNNLKIPNVAKVLLREGENSEGYVTSDRTTTQPARQWQPWEAELLEKANMEDAPAAEKQSFVDKVASSLTSLYGRLQGKAGEVTGVKPGAAWIEALEAGTENGLQQIHLGDMPSDLVGKDLAKGIWEGLNLRVQAAAAIAAVSVTLAVTHTLPEGGQPIAVGAVAAATALAVLPFLGPLLEVYLFSRKSAADITKTVRIKESLQARGTEMLRLPGEDAIISWPNAKSTVIDQRDAYMARTLWAAATGKGAAPAFVRDHSHARDAWHYCMPSEAPEGVSLKGLGIGTYKGVKNVKTVVGIVGSAHVGGIVREWESAAEQDKLTELINKQR